MQNGIYTTTSNYDLHLDMSLWYFIGQILFRACQVVLNYGASDEQFYRNFYIPLWVYFMFIMQELCKIKNNNRLCQFCGTFVVNTTYQKYRPCNTQILISSSIQLKLSGYFIVGIVCVEHCFFTYVWFDWNSIEIRYEFSCKFVFTLE